ncbi:hypothetical protein [Candidatus Macondimonas diazotrophica]|jgi:hypothetical protein|uniref:Uncharacterized protein n=1 Tax=Candidatus Macondimonas diazotrophica TaxID=2305248 RepID=A0A4Z0F7Q8_9GAMM|nr:hypothetical protein [Candidatus Macondimonas diazotrophica]TFZ81470.1 hypothetical protein E4680_12380 [Candidatus Macondimonas diazotrophica]
MKTLIVILVTLSIIIGLLNLILLLNKSNISIESEWVCTKETFTKKSIPIVDENNVGVFILNIPECEQFSKTQN